MKKQSTPSSKIISLMHETRDELSPFLTRLDFEILSKHNHGYLNYAIDPISKFIDSEIHVHSRIVECFSQMLPLGSKIIDIGFFIPVVPIALAKLGYHVESIEKLELYEDSLNELIDFASHNYGIKVHDLDIINDEIQPLINRYDGVILSAFLEHLNGSPKALLEKARILGTENALFWISVPNAASFKKRLLMLLKGVPPFPPISDYYNSDYPFTGHNREYTMRDLKFVLEKSGFDIISIEGCNRSLRASSSIKEFLMRMVSQVNVDSTKESLVAIARNFGKVSLDNS